MKTSSYYTVEWKKHNPAAYWICAGLTALAMAVILLWHVPFVYAEEVDQSQDVFRFVMSHSILDHADPQDVKIAMELWARELLRSLDKKKYSVKVSRNFEETQKILQKGDLDFILFSSIDYLKLRDLAKSVPILVGSNDVGESREYLLVVRNDSGIKTVKDLRGKRIALLAEKQGSQGSIWLDVLLMRNGAWNRDAFFLRVLESTSYPRAVMAAFFDKADAAIVTRGAYETANALNPQVGRRLHVIEKSKDLIGRISCILPSTSKKLRSQLEDVGIHLHESPTGRQILTLFKFDRIIRFQPSYLTGLQELLRERDRLLAMKKKRRYRANR
ncbi:MAG TPA: PhnD/SsuA/transferrin family substrate-binding protein [Geobacteraceae bacterium]|nr:PhnD/SsuA/transferrin family substrate-binding protein [Geobacteraceae bacterium]